jgi:flagellar protein FlgJ
VDAAGLNRGVAELLGSGVAGYPQTTSVSALERIADGTVTLRRHISAQESRAHERENGAVDETSDPELQKLRDVCRDFEAIFLHQLLQIMRSSGPESDLLDSGFASDVYEDILDQQLATEMSRTGGFGLADILYEQMREVVVAQYQEENNTTEAE